MKLGRVEPLAASLDGGERLRDDIEGGPGLTRVAERLGQQTEEVRLEVFRAQASNARDPGTHRREPFFDLPRFGQGPTAGHGRPRLELHEPPLAGERGSSLGTLTSRPPVASELM